MQLYRTSLAPHDSSMAHLKIAAASPGECKTARDTTEGRISKRRTQAAQEYDAVAA
jgi:hypothetical protein